MAIKVRYVQFLLEDWKFCHSTFQAVKGGVPTIFILQWILFLHIYYDLVLEGVME